MSAVTQISLQDYFQTTTEPESEYVNGELFPKAMGSKPHSRLQKRLIILLDPFEQLGLGQVSPEQSVQLSPTKVLIPDVCLLQPTDSAKNIVTDPPLLCVEILSPSDRLPDTVKKCQDYLQWGVPSCWIPNPESRKAWDITLTGFNLASNSLQVGEFRLPIVEVFPPEPQA